MDEYKRWVLIRRGCRLGHHRSWSRIDWCRSRRDRSRSGCHRSWCRIDWCRSRRDRSGSQRSRRHWTGIWVDAKIFIGIPDIICITDASRNTFSAVRPLETNKAGLKQIEEEKDVRNNLLSSFRFCNSTIVCLRLTAHSQSPSQSARTGETKFSGERKIFDDRHANQTSAR